MLPLLMLALAWAHADSPLCFDFTKPEALKALGQPPAPEGAPLGDPVTAQGEPPSGKTTGVWGSARARLDLPMARALELLRDQATLKNPKDTDIQIKRETRAGYLDFQTGEFEIHPFPLVSVEWTEVWAYRLLAGTEKAPTSAVIYYQKTAGTSHIRYFCGNIWLKAAPGGKTDFAVYEQTDADYRAAKDVAKGHLGTIRTIMERARERTGTPSPAASPSGTAKP